jgi:hypothetical protein
MPHFHSFVILALIQRSEQGLDSCHEKVELLLSREETMRPSSVHVDATQQRQLLWEWAVRNIPKDVPTIDSAFEIVGQERRNLTEANDADNVIHDPAPKRNMKGIKQWALMQDGASAKTDQLTMDNLLDSCNVIEDWQIMIQTVIDSRIA